MNQILKAGQIVEHKKYGKGIVIGYVQGDLCQVSFVSGLVKEFRYTNLLTLSN